MAPIAKKVIAEDQKMDPLSQGASSSSESSLAAVSLSPRGNSLLFFAAAVLVSVLAAGGFLIAKTFL